MRETRDTSRQNMSSAANERLFRACAKLNLAGIRQALDGGADIGAADRCGRTVLDIVTENAFLEHERYDDCVDGRVRDIVQTLLESGAAPDGAADESRPSDPFAPSTERRHASYPSRIKRYQMRWTLSGARPATAFRPFASQDSSPARAARPTTASGGRRGGRFWKRSTPCSSNARRSSCATRPSS